MLFPRKCENFVRNTTLSVGTKGRRTCCYKLRFNMQRLSVMMQVKSARTKICRDTIHILLVQNYPTGFVQVKYF